MNRAVLTWGIPAVIYLAFFAWYTNLAGPLTPEEIDGYLTVFRERELPPERIERLHRFMQEDAGDDFQMLNAIHLHDEPDRVGEVATGETSEQVMNRYMEYMLPALLRRACHPTVFGDAVAPAMDLAGIDGADVWTQGALMRYRSRRDMLEVATDPAFRDTHIYKLAAMEKTIAYPIETRINLGEPRVLVALILLVLAMGAQQVANRA